MKERILITIAALPGVFFVLFGLHGMYYDYQLATAQRHRIETRTAQAEGTVIELHNVVSARSGTSHKAGSIVFTTDTGKQVQLNPHFIGDDASIGMKMNVYYDPTQPDNNALSNTQPDSFNFSALLSSLFGVLLLVGLLTQIKKARSQQ